jgi:hypothetical protein
MKKTATIAKPSIYQTVKVLRAAAAILSGWSFS